MSMQSSERSTSLRTRPPHVFVTSNITSQVPPALFVFRNYEYPPNAKVHRETRTHISNTFPSASSDPSSIR